MTDRDCVRLASNAMYHDAMKADDLKELSKRTVY